MAGSKWRSNVNQPISSPSQQKACKAEIFGLLPLTILHSYQQCITLKFIMSSTFLEDTMKKTYNTILVGVFIALAACSSNQLNEKTEVSECQENLPFAQVAITQALKTDSTTDSQTERLLWAYDEETKTLSFMHDNLCNTCGDDWEYSLILTKQDEKNGYSLVSFLKDTSKDSAKCWYCIYDLKTSAVIEEEQSINLTFSKKRDSFDDEKGEKEIWSGKIELAQRTGQIFISDNQKCLIR